MRAVGRIIAAMIGYIFAVLAAALFLLVARVDLAATGNSGVDALFWTDFGLSVFWVAGMLGAAAFVPAVALIIVGEVFALRSIVFHLVAGGLLAGAAVLGLSSRLSPATDDPSRATVLLAAGFVGGFVYWLVAGRMAGLAPRPRPDDLP